MRQRLTVAAVLAVFVVIGTWPTAHAQMCGVAATQSAASCLSPYGTFTPGSPGSAPQPGGTWPPEGWLPYPIVQRQPGGPFDCVTTGYYPPDGPNPILQYPPGTFDPWIEYPPCEPGPATGQVDPATIAAMYWETIPLPKPAPRIAPGWAISGKTAYLETNGTLSHVHSSATPVGPLEIVATGTYYVDWGDGESGGPFKREGAAWPEGTITHQYVWAGEYDVVVTERWTAIWSLGGKSGVLRELRTVGRIDDFLVREIQAVIITGR